MPPAGGKTALQSLVKAHKAEYDALSPEEKTQLTRELEEYKANKACGLRISTKSRINDVTQTIKAIETEVHIYFHCQYSAEFTLPFYSLKT
jgi:hypothetical protein